MSEKTYEISLRLNGREKRFRVEERETLLRLLDRIVENLKEELRT